VALLAAIEWAEFTFIRNALEDLIAGAKAGTAETGGSRPSPVPPEGGSRFWADEPRAKSAYSRIKV